MLNYQLITLRSAYSEPPPPLHRKVWGEIKPRWTTRLSNIPSVHEADATYCQSLIQSIATSLVAPGAAPSPPLSSSASPLRRLCYFKGQRWRCMRHYKRTDRSTGRPLVFWKRKVRYMSWWGVRLDNYSSLYRSHGLSTDLTFRDGDGASHHSHRFCGQIHREGRRGRSLYWRPHPGCKWVISSRPAPTAQAFIWYYGFFDGF